MNRRRLRHGDGWTDQVNPVRATLLTVASAASAALSVALLVGVLPDVSARGDTWLAVGAVLASLLSSFNAYRFGVAAYREVRRR